MTGGLEAHPGGAPATTVTSSELEDDSAMELKVEMWRTETLQGELTVKSWAKHRPAEKW